MIFSAVNKDPNAVLDFLFDWAAFLGSDTIATSTFPSFPTGITNQSTTNTPKTVTLWLANGARDHDYDILNRITTAQGRTMDWLLRVRVTEPVIVPVGPPYATVAEAEAYQPAAEGAEAMKVEMVLEDASDIVQRLAPRPPLVTSTLVVDMDLMQSTMTLASLNSFPQSDTLKIDSELISYFGKQDTAGGAFYSGEGNLTTLVRGVRSTTASSHAAGAVVELVGYPIKARRAELAVFEWLWDTRGYKPSRSGVVGSESFSIGPELRSLVQRIMGTSYPGGMKSAAVGSSFVRPDTYARQRGWR